MSDELKYDENSPRVKEGVMKNMLLIGCISISMIFIGLSSGYLVTRADNFWVKITPPTWFYISTLFVVLASITFHFSYKSAQKNNNKNLKSFLCLTFLFGGMFVYSQFKGWGQLKDTGNFMVGNIMSKSIYADEYAVGIDGEMLDYDGVDYLLYGKPLEKDNYEKLVAYCREIEQTERETHIYKLDDFPQFSIFKKIGEEFVQLEYAQNQFYATHNGERHLMSIDNNVRELQQFARNIAEERGDFMLVGRYGEDFAIQYAGEELTYKNRVLAHSTGPLSDEEMLDLELSRNSASSYVYIISGMHLLHLFGGILYLLVLLTKALRNKYNSDNYLKIKGGAIYWHFLGGLWIYLFLFFIFIH